MDEGTLLFAGVMGLGLAAALITGATLLSNAIARRFKFRNQPLRYDAEGDWPTIPSDLKIAFHSAPVTDERG